VDCSLIEWVDQVGETMFYHSDGRSSEIHVGPPSLTALHESRTRFRPVGSGSATPLLDVGARSCFRGIDLGVVEVFPFAVG
jgi:hypothetical protein